MLIVSIAIWWLSVMTLTVGVCGAAARGDAAESGRLGDVSAAGGPSVGGERRAEPVSGAIAGHAVHAGARTMVQQTAVRSRGRMALPMNVTEGSARTPSPHVSSAKR